MSGERAVSTTVSYVLTLSITTVLVAGLLIGGGTFVDDQRQTASRSELRVLGQQLAGDIAAADRLSQTSGTDGDLSLRQSFPDRIAGSGYRINVSQVGASDTYELRLETDTPDVSTDVRVFSTTPVFMKSNLTSGTTTVEYNSVAETLLVKQPDPYAFREESGRVSIEAETYPADEPGTGNASTHYWTAFEDDAASGDTAVVARPNESDVNTNNDAYGPRLEYEVNFRTTGTYYVWVRTRGPSSSDDSVHVGLDGTPATDVTDGLGLGDSTPGDGDWDWSNDVTDTSTDATVTVNSAGTHTVTVWMREDGIQVDKIVLTTSSSPSFDTGSDDSDTGPPESEWG